jgi:transposase
LVCHPSVSIVGSKEALMQANQVFVGIDVAKLELVIGRHAVAGRITIANEAAAIKRWLKTLPADAVVAMESTGRYHGLLADLVERSGRKVYVLNARDVRYYAKALGARSKTDGVDAQVIARYVAEHHASLHAWTPGSHAQRQVQALVQRRAQVGVHRAALRQLLRGFPAVRPALQELEQRFDALLAQIDRHVDAEIGTDATLSRGRALLKSITGFGPQSSALLTVLLARIPFANADALVAYSGLDPRAHDSGTRRGRRRLSKRGSAALRRQLYLSAFSAGRSKALAPLYRSIKARGFKPTQAIVILARKLLRVAWAVWKSGTRFDPSRLAPPKPCAQL